MEHHGLRPPLPRIPEQEIRLEFVRSSGPGGQNVNKTSSKVQLRWHVGGSQAFTDEQKALIRTGAGNRLNGDDEIMLASQTTRSQGRNRVEAFERLQNLVAKALMPKKTRKPTRVSYAQKQRRLADKRHSGEVKRTRKPPRGEQ